MHNQQLGNKGEDLAVTFMQQKGFEVLARNWRYKHLEVDIILQKEGLLILAEVKTRSTDAYGSPLEAVGYKKQKNYRNAAEAWCEKTGFEGEIRFDVVAIVHDGQKSLLQHYEDVF